MKHFLIILGFFASFSLGHGCMPPDTLVLMESGDFVAIHEIHAGRKVKAFNPKLGKDVADMVRT